MIPRPANAADIEMLARIHVQSWQEAYPGLLPAAAIASRTLDQRTAIWTRVMAETKTRVWVINDLGFAQFGPQREDMWREQGYPQELYAMYLLRAGYGLGRPLLHAAFGPGGQPFTACVIAGNACACAFYEKAGGIHLLTRDDTIGQSAITERVYGWTARPFAG